MDNRQKEMEDDDHGIPNRRSNTLEYPIPSQEDNDIDDPLALSMAFSSSSSTTRAPGVLSSQYHHAPPSETPLTGQPPPEQSPFMQPSVLPWFFLPEHSLPDHFVPSSDVPLPPANLSPEPAPAPAGEINLQAVYRQEVPGPSSRRTGTRQRRILLSNEDIPAPYPWATERRATIQTYKDLIAKQIETIEGQVQCKKCQHQYVMRLNLTEKLKQVVLWFADHKDSLHDRAPERWKNPVLPNCENCHEQNCVKPIISGEMEKINWLFLLLGEMIGLCTLRQLRYFCTYTSIHRTGAKDRLVYQTYLTLCKQLLPEGPF